MEHINKNTDSTSEKNINPTELEWAIPALVAFESQESAFGNNCTEGSSANEWCIEGGAATEG